MAHSSVSLLNRQIARVRRRLFLQYLLQALIRCWLAALVLAVGWFLAQPYVLPDASASLRWMVAGGLCLAGTLLAIVLAALGTPSRIAAALALDEGFSLKERVTTTVTLAESELASPAGQALLADVHTRLSPLRVRDRFPLRISWLAALVPVGVAALLLLAFFYHPVLNSTQAASDQPLVDGPVAKAQIDKALRPLQRNRAKKLDERKSEDLQRLEAELDRLAQKPRDTKEQARELVKDLTNAEEEVRKREKQIADRVDALKAQMKQAERLSPKDQKEKKDGPAKNLDKALDQADLKKAQEEAERLGKQLQADEQIAKLKKKSQDEKLTDEQKKEMREQLEKLKDQELSGEQKEKLQKQLGDMKDRIERLTRSDEARERLRELQRQGAINQEELERELDQLDKNMAKLDKETLEQLQELANKLGQCQKCMKDGDRAGAAKKMAEAAEQLAKLDPKGECKELKQKLQELQNARQCMCRALDGNPVPDAGRRPESKDGETASKEEWSHSQMDKGRLQVIDHVPGDGFKGPRKPAEMTEEIRRALQEEPEALDRQRLPRSASDMARGYFEKLRGPDRDGKKGEKP